MMMNNNRTLVKTRTFQYNRSSSMELQNPNPRHQSTTTTTFVPPRSTSFSGPRNRSPEFPTSPQRIFGEERFHASHPQHPLAQIDHHDLFTCDGCKEHGSGKRFTCRQCVFQLHEFSQQSSLPLSTPTPLEYQTSFQMHPCCAKLSNGITYPLHPHTLKMLPMTASTTMTTNGDQPGFVCGECKRKKSGKVYRCTVCDYYLHAACAKDMVNGLLDNNIKEPGKPSKFGNVARLASKVVIVFLDGLIHGFGEVVGEALGQSLTRSGRPNRTIINKQQNRSTEDDQWYLS
ncbi:hypothetical protein LWI29_020065 [Acer saccharum]|uniref:DC1 domain-containing protein n=1 Tax=Acer saccharum TaxID=4024 RepID=A0AA39RLW2_ACESA|nr:hypothetical protein LWI29_020065 [Acer saccharum]